MRLRGRALKLGNDINTDSIISGRYKFSITDIKELAKHIMEDIDPHFIKKITPGASIIVAGENFGMGSSREQAPLAIKAAGITAVLAKSFARIFFRNSFNIGLALVETDTSKIKARDRIDIDLDKGLVSDSSRNLRLKVKPLPKFMQRFLKEGGVVKYIKKHKKIKV
ncbi:3-isopropylmalate dehydratase [Candidatus Omnitrophota bacterium]